jgi:hypothetical protein
MGISVSRSTMDCNEEGKAALLDFGPTQERNNLETVTRWPKVLERKTAVSLDALCGMCF